MNNQTPNLESLVQGFNQPDTPISPAVQVLPAEPKEDIVTEDTQSPTSSTLWEEFMATLSTAKDDSSALAGKPYKIDEDIVETIQQCSFKGNSTQVLNSILRTFLVANLPRLREIRMQKIQSLFEKYPQDENN